MTTVESNGSAVGSARVYDERGGGEDSACQRRVPIRGGVHLPLLGGDRLSFHKGQPIHS